MVPYAPTHWKKHNNSSFIVEWQRPLGPFTVGVLLLGQRTLGICHIGLGVHHDLLLFDQSILHK